MHNDRAGGQVRGGGAWGSKPAGQGGGRVCWRAVDLIRFGDKGRWSNKTQLLTAPPGWKLGGAGGRCGRGGGGCTYQSPLPVLVSVMASPRKRPEEDTPGRAVPPRGHDRDGGDCGFFLHLGCGRRPHPSRPPPPRTHYQQ